MARTCLLSAVLILVCAAFCHADDEEQVYHERFEYNPATGDWSEVAPPIPGTEEGDLALARSLLARGRFKEARKAFKEWFEIYPDSDRWAEALFYAAETEILAVEEKPKGGDIMKAYNWLEEVLQGWPGTDLADRALRKEMIIAELLLFKDRKQKIWRGVLWLSGKDEALHMLDRIIDEWAHGTPVAEQALRLKADYHYINGEFEEAELSYARLVREFPRGRYHKIAMLRSGESALARFPGVDFDDADLLEAEVYLSDFQTRYPQDAADRSVPQILTNIRERRAEKEYRIASYYERTNQIDAAVYYYRYIEENWPATIWAVEAHGRLVSLGAVPLELTQEDLQAAGYTFEPEDADAAEPITLSEEE